MTVLGKVTRELPEDRGPDVIHRICVPPDWLERGERIVVKLPRLLSCARCEGGGCDRCERRGAVTLRESDEPAELSVRLAAGPQAQLLRLPDQGGKGAAEAQPRGCLMLQVESGEMSEGVRREADSTPQLAAGFRRGPWLGAVAALVILLLLWLL